MAGRRDPSQPEFIPREHAEPLDIRVLTCAMCGAQAVQHLAIADGWVAKAMPTGLGYICSKTICKTTAAKEGAT